MAQMIKTSIGSAAKEILVNLVGSTLESVSGPGLPSYLISPRIFVSASTGNVELFGDVEDSPIADFEGVMSTLNVDVALREEVELAKTQGNVYRQKSGMDITSVRVIRETATCTNGGSLNWVYESDIGILLVLSGGFLVVSKLGQHDEALKVQFLDEFNPMIVERLDSYFESDLIQNIVYSREVVTI